MTDDYRAHVHALFERDSDLVVSNSEPAHAAILIEALLKYSKQRVSIFCRNLNPEIYDQKKLIQELVEAVISRGVSVHVIVQENPKEGNFLQTLKLLSVFCRSREKSVKDSGKLPHEVSIRQCSPGSQAAMAESNFVVADRKSYRFEKDREKINAFACVNDPASANMMEVNFSRYLDDAQINLSFAA